MDPWYKVVTPRKEVREGRSFDPNEFAVHLEQVVAGTAPEDYRDPEKFFSRTFFTRALSEHAGMVLRRLSGETANTSAVLTLVTQFGGGKTHTLAALYHLVKNGQRASDYPGVAKLLRDSSLKSVPGAQVAVFVGNAWDPGEGRETPWIDLARQLAGERGVALLGPVAREAPPGTETLGKVFDAAGGSVLLLFDEVLNFLNRHRNLAEPFYAFLQNLTVATTGTMRGAAVLSLPRYPTEMTDWDLQWQEKITKVVRRVAKDLISNDEAEISEVVRRRLFQELGSERVRKRIAKVYADWCFERRAQLPPEWTAVDSAATEIKAREFLQSRFEACYPFHPATLSVFQRKWQALLQYQRTRGTLAMLAQWVSWAQKDAFSQARTEPLITLGSAPLGVAGFRSVVLGQLGEARLSAAIDADIAGDTAHARALDADTKGPLRDIHRRVGTTILFESSGGQVDKVAHLPELRFALGEPQVDTTSIDAAALALEARSFFIRRVGSDGFQIRHQPTLKKVVSDRRASLDEETEVRPQMSALIKAEFERGRTIPLVCFPADGSSVQDASKLSLVVGGPDFEWSGSGETRTSLAEWTRQRGMSPRLCPGSLVWCVKKPGRELRNKVEELLAWKRVASEIREGTLGGDFDRADLAGIQSSVKDAEEAARDEVWAGYRFVVVWDSEGADGLRLIDLGAGHASSSETLCGRVLAALKSEALLSESIGAGYVERNWQDAFKGSGAWPLASLRQAFLNGTLTRLLDPDRVLGTKIPEWVANGDFGLASGLRQDGSYERLWYAEMVSPDEVTFERDVYLLSREKARQLKEAEARPPEGVAGEGTGVGGRGEGGEGPEGEGEGVEPEPPRGGPPERATMTLRLSGTIPPELWNRFGTKVIPKLKSGGELKVNVDFSVSVDANLAPNLRSDLQQIAQELGVADRLDITTQQPEADE